jgi:hypothetical protein
VSTSLIVVKTLQPFSTAEAAQIIGKIFSTPVTESWVLYLTARKDYPIPLPTRRIFVRPVFAKSEHSTPLLQVNVQLSRTNR